MRERTEAGTFVGGAIEFWSKVDKGYCWEWTGYRNKKGYGRTYADGKKKLAHHVAWWLTHGEWPAYLMHSCDNRACVNPDHLSHGTPASNNKDRDDKGRQHRPSGESNPASVLTRAIVLSMRAMHADGDTCPEIARRFGVDRTQVWRIVTRKAWGHV